MYARLNYTYTLNMQYHIAMLQFDVKTNAENVGGASFKTLNERPWMNNIMIVQRHALN